METEQNLKDAFAGESQANRKYLAFAKKAEEEGYEQVAKLFRAAAEAETVHALSHLRAMDGIGATEENLKEAIDGETHEYVKMYPEMIKEAEKEQHSTALISFNRAKHAEGIHASLYQKALESVKSGKDLDPQDIYVCPVCGHTVEGSAPDKCPVCGATKDMFMKTL
jgi:rubrerythrin